MYEFELQRQFLPNEKLTQGQIAEHAHRFLNIKTVADLAALLKMQPTELMSYSLQKQEYESFYVPKPKGGKRFIENPCKRLKAIQRKLNLYLQCVYYFAKPNCAYGFVLTAAHDEQPRHILTNAAQHLGQRWLLNIDLADFFHHVSTKRVQDILRSKPFALNDHAALIISNLCTHNGRLPMGAPTSPVLSNFACGNMDTLLAAFAAQHDLIYTRYADDMTFSSSKKLSSRVLIALKAAIVGSNFVVNEQKVHLTHRRDLPEVTGLILYKKRVDVAPSLLRNIQKQLVLLNAFSQVQVMPHEGFYTPDLPPELLNKMRATVQGQINFVGFVRGKTSKLYQKLCKKMSKVFVQKVKKEKQ
jgi:RNA-directed DNA polymerase